MLFTLGARVLDASAIPMWRVWSAGFNQGVLDVASITTDPATRAELTTGLLRAMDGGPSEDDSTEEGRARQRAAAAPAAAPDLVDQVVPNARNAQAQNQQQAAAAAAALGADRLELQAGARWLEDSLPFVVLLLLVFLQQHIFGIGAFCWLSTVLHNANARIRTQVLLKEQRDSLAVLSLASLLFSQMCMVVMLCGASKLRAQLALRPEHDGRQASSIFELLWAVLVSDLMVRRAARRRAVRAAAPPLLLLLLLLLAAHAAARASASRRRHRCATGRCSSRWSSRSCAPPPPSAASAASSLSSRAPGSATARCCRCRCGTSGCSDPSR